MSIFTEIGKWIKGWKLDKFFHGLTNGDKDSAVDLQLSVEKGLEFVNKVKEYLRNPMGDFITSVIPGDWDSELKAKAEQVLEKIASNAGVLTECVNKENVGEQLSCIYSKILSLNDEDEEDSFWHKFGVIAAKVFADGKLTFGDAVVAAEMVYRIITKKPLTD